YQAIEFLHNHFTLHGNALGSLRRRAESARDHDQAFRLAVWLVRLHPNDTIPQRRLAVNHLVRGLIRGREGRRGGAEALEGQAATIQERLLQRYPRVLAIRQELARTNVVLGKHYARPRLGETADARRGREELSIRFLHNAVALAESLVDDSPDVPVYRRDLEVWQGELLNAVCGQNAPKEPEARLRHEIRQLESWVKSASLATYEVGLVKKLDALVELLTTTGRHEEALPLARRAFRLSREMVASALPRDVADRKQWVVQTGLSLAIVRRDLEQYEEAMAVHDAVDKTC